MTGYGRGRAESGGREFIIEVKAVNHRYNDIFIKLPRELAALEDKIREKAGKNVSRGKTDIYVTYNNHSAASKKVIADENLAGMYIEAIRNISNKFGLENDISVSLISRFPDVLKSEETGDDLDDAWTVLNMALQDAMDSFVAMRAIEGEKLSDDLRGRLKTLDLLIAGISIRAPEIVTAYRQKLTQRIIDLTGQQIADEGRLAMEIAIFADRSSVDEEITRLRSHLIQFSDILGSGGPVGRKLDFLVQELNREINTIASKANDIAITNQTLDFKSELERIREQVQNIE